MPGHVEKDSLNMTAVHQNLEEVLRKGTEMDECSVNSNNTFHRTGKTAEQENPVASERSAYITTEC